MAWRKTPLFSRHLAAGARMVEFAGWEMPVSFAGINHEVGAVRQRAGLFDVSHLGQLELQGKDAGANLQRLLTNEVMSLRAGRGVYSPMCNDNGGTMDDLIAFRVTEDTWRLVVNASRVEVDVEWIAGHLTGDARLVNLSDDLALLALQGPGSEAALSPHVEGDIRGMKHNDCLRVNVCGCASLLSRTGYTGEDGFEISFAAGDVTTVWDALAASAGVALCGLGARDVLRLEAGLCLYGHELSETITPLEAGLAWTVKWEKEDFIGRAVLWRAKETGIRRQLTGIRMLERGIPRAGCDVEVDGTLIGRVTSGTYSVTVGAGIALALVDIKWASPGHEVMINIRGEHKRGVTVKTPFVVSHAKHGKPAKQSKEEFA